jgi:hypothetical protein
MTPLLSGYPALTVGLACSGQDHRVRWEQGELLAPDHDDAEGERALVALGGPRCACIDLLDLWARHADDPDVLALTSRGPADPVRWSGPDRPAARPFVAPPPGARRGTVRTRGTGFVMMTGSAPVGSMVPAGQTVPAAEPPDVTEVLDLDPRLADRLALTVAATWAGRLADGDPRVAPVRAALEAALYGRATAALRLWLARPDLAVQLEMIPPGQDPSIEIPEPATAGVTAHLPLAWLVEVWGRGVAVVTDRFTVASESAALDSAGPASADFDELRLRTVGHDGDIRVLTLRLGHQVQSVVDDP